jgi:hypothetical protein
MCTRAGVWNWPLSAEFQNAWSFTSALPLRLHGVLLIHRCKFTAYNHDTAMDRSPEPRLQKQCTKVRFYVAGRTSCARRWVERWGWASCSASPPCWPATQVGMWGIAPLRPRVPVNPAQWRSGVPKSFELIRPHIWLNSETMGTFTVEEHCHECLKMKFLRKYLVWCY